MKSTESESDVKRNWGANSTSKYQERINAPLASHASRLEKKCHIINFMRYSTFAEPGPMHGSRGKPSMRVRRENFHIISPSPTRGPAGYAAFPVYRLVATVLWYGVRCVCCMYVFVPSSSR
ncbi:hypothetical protein QTP88_018424 [Uroleucon formosanum]